MAERLGLDVATPDPDPNPDLLLAIESATKRASVALMRGDAVLAELDATPGDAHAERLLPMIDQLLTEQGTGLGEVGAFAISIGPGAFTSLRIGLATLKGLVFDADLPVAAVSTLQAVAQTASTLGRIEPGELCVAVLDARRGEFYAGAYRAPVAPSVSVSPAEISDFVFDPTELAERLVGPVRIVGEGAALFGEAIAAAARGADVRIDTGEAVWPTARSVGALGAEALARGEKRSVAGLIPAYLRRAQAEEERLARLEG